MSARGYVEMRVRQSLRRFSSDRRGRWGSEWCDASEVVMKRGICVGGVCTAEVMARADRRLFVVSEQRT